MALDGFDSIELIYDKVWVRKKAFKKPSNICCTIEQLHIYSFISQDNVYMYKKKDITQHYAALLPDTLPVTGFVSYKDVDMP